MIDGKYEYFAFISYKEEDAEWAKWLQRALENYTFPTSLRKEHAELPKKIRPVYEYKSDAEGGRLRKVLWKGLTRSKYLIVICSPRATKSEWLNDGIRYFVESGLEENIIPFIVEGSPKSINPAEECFPSALLDLKGDRELRGININEGGREFAAVKVISQMFNLKFTDLWSRYEREQKLQRRRKIGFILGFLSILVVVSLIFAFFMSDKNKHLELTNKSLIEANDSIKKINLRLEETTDSLSRANDKINTINDRLKKMNFQLVKANNDLSFANDSIQKISKQLEVTNTALNIQKDKEKELKSTIDEKNTELLLAYSKLGDDNNLKRIETSRLESKLRDYMTSDSTQKQNSLLKMAKTRFNQINVDLYEMNINLENDINKAN